MTAPPIFIVGAPRSGTSLLRQILNRHPSLAICDETHFFRLIWQKRRRDAFGDLSDPANRRRLVNEYVQLRPTQRLALDGGKLAERLIEEGSSYPRLFASVLQYYAESQGKTRCGEKTPLHAFAVNTLCEWFPGAYILHIVRDPRDVVASLLRMPFGSRSVVLNARTWLQRNVAARKASHHDHYLEVRYETLVAEPAQQLTRLCRFIGEEFSPSMLIAEQTGVQRPDERDRYHAPLTKARLGRWRQELSPRQVAQIEWVVGPQLEAFGYAREARSASMAAVVGGLSYAALVQTRQNFSKLPALWYSLSSPKEIAKYESLARRKAWAANERGTKTGPR